MRHLDRDLRLMTLAVLLYALGVGLFLQLLWVYALNLGSSRFTLGVLNAIMLATIAAGNIPGAWAARRFRLKPVIVAVWWLTVPAGLTLFLAPSWPWLIPGLVIFGLSFANSPAMKSYVYLKSEPSRVARNLTIVLGAYPLGLVVAPLVGGQVAAHLGMRTVFLISTAFFAVSPLTITFIRDTHYHSAETPLEPEVAEPEPPLPSLPGLLPRRVPGLFPHALGVGLFLQLLWVRAAGERPHTRGRGSRGRWT